VIFLNQFTSVLSENSGVQRTFGSFQQLGQLHVHLCQGLDLFPVPKSAHKLHVEHEIVLREFTGRVLHMLEK
jgi:hypothetical protein